MIEQEHIRSVIITDRMSLNTGSLKEGSLASHIAVPIVNEDVARRTPRPGVTYLSPEATTSENFLTRASKALARAGRNLLPGEPVLPQRSPGE